MTELFKQRDVPEVVALVAMGGSRDTYISEVMKCGGKEGVADETWVVNKLAAVLDHDICFRMDDLRKPRSVNERRGSNRDPEKTIHETQTDFMKNHNKPIITSTAYPEFPTSIAFPLEEVINTIGYSYLLTTPGYAAAFAIHIGVKHLKIFGCDYVYKNNIYIGESGRANLEFILAIGMMKGMRVDVAPTSTLLGMNMDIAEHLYGYEHIIEVVESEDPNKRYEIKHRHDMTKKRNEELYKKEKEALQALMSKHNKEVAQDLIIGGWVTQEDFDKYSKKEVSNETENDNSIPAHT